MTRCHGDGNSEVIEMLHKQKLALYIGCIVLMSSVVKPAMMDAKRERTLLPNQHMGSIEIRDVSQLSELSRKVGMDLYVPAYSGSASTYEIIVPADRYKASAPQVLIHYFDDQDTFLFGLWEQKNNTDVSKTITEINVEKKTVTERVVKKRFRFEPTNEEELNINGTKAWFDPNTVEGRTLKMLVPGDLYIEVSSYHLSKEKMIEVAASLQTTHM